MVHLLRQAAVMFLQEVEQMYLVYIMVRLYEEKLNCLGKPFKFTRDNNNAYERHIFATLIAGG